MNKKNPNIPITSTQIGKLTDIFHDDNQKDQINMLIENNLPETKQTITDIQHDTGVFIEKLRTTQKARSGRALLNSHELDTIVQKYDINDNTRRELIKQMISIIKIITEKHRKFTGKHIIDMILNLGQTINQKKTITKLITNEIKKYLYQKKYIQANLLSQMLYSGLELTKYGPDENNISHFRNDKRLFDMQLQSETKKGSFIKQQRFAHAEKLFEGKQYEKAEKLFKKLIQPKHIMGNDIPSIGLITFLKNTMTRKQKVTLPRKLREDGKAIQIPAKYLALYLGKTLSLDRAVLSTEFSLFHESEKMKQDKPYKEHLGFSGLIKAIENLNITRIIDDKKGNIHFILRDAYKRNDELDHTTIKKIYGYLKQIDTIRQEEPIT